MENKFGSLLKELRGKRGYTINKLAEKSGVSAAHISRIENGLRPAPAPGIIEKISSVLGDYEGLMEAADYITPKDTALWNKSKENVFKYGSFLLDSSGWIEKTNEYAKKKNLNPDKFREYIKNMFDRFEELPVEDQIIIATEFSPVIQENNLPENYVLCGQTVKIPIIGTVSCGMPLFAEQNIIGYEDVPIEDVKGGEFFFLVIKGDSMIGSRIYPGDKVLVRRQDDIENGQIAVVAVGKEEATLKRVKFMEEAIILYPDNQKYQPQIYKLDEVKIVGRVVEVKFKV